MAKKKEVFSVTKAVKRNARDRVGQPRPAKVLLSLLHKRERQRQPTLEELLNESSQEFA
jgi:hypothetical protein